MLEGFCSAPLMNLADLIQPGHVIAEMRSDDQMGAIAELVDHLIDSGGLARGFREEAVSALRSREEQRSTGIGGGVAIPHCFLPGLDEVVAVFGRSSGGIDFCAVDHAPVYFVVLFMVPEAQHTLHLKTLAAIAKVLNSAEIRSRLATALDAADILDVLAPKPSPA